MVSTSKPTRRRRPTQARGAERQTALLEAAAHLFAEKGFESVTMTAIAQKAGASFGALYDYFPDKVSIARAVFAMYTQEVDALWAGFLREEVAVSPAQVAEGIVETTFSLFQTRPAYLVLLEAPLALSRSRSARMPLRETFANLIRRLHPKASAEELTLGADVLLGLLKCFLKLHKEAAQNEKAQLKKQFVAMLTEYLAQGVLDG